MGNRETQHPAIESPTEDNYLDVLDQVKESLEIGRKDKRGDPLDRWATLRDLNKFGLTSIPDESSISAGGPGPQLGDPGDILPLPPDDGSEFLKPFDPNEPRPLPSRPINVRTVSLWDSIMVKWDWPEDGPTVDWKGAVIWMSTTPVFSEGNFLGYGSVNFFVHEDIGLSGGDNYTTRYYWVAWWGVVGSTGGIGNPYEIPGIGTQTEWSPYHYQPGVRGDTAVDPEYVLRVLQKQITESQIYNTLNTRINLVDYDSEGNQYTEHVQDRILSASFGANEQIYAAIAETVRTAITDTGATGEYAVKLDLNGYIVGFGFSALAYIDGEGQNTGETSTFVIKADSFAVVYAKSGPDDIIIPFVIGQVDGQSTVGIDGRLVVDGTIVARTIQAESIGAREINANEVWAEMVTAERIISTTFRTREWPALRLEINGVGSVSENFPLWFGQGNTAGASANNSTPAFYFTNTGDMVLSGELRVTGPGKFYIGRNLAGEYRVEIGGHENETLFWAGRGQVTTAESSNRWLMYIDKAGNMKLRGDLEARFVSGEISRTGVIDRYENVTAPRVKGANGEYVTDTSQILEADWVDVGEYMLPESVFEPHLPVFHVDMNLFGGGVRAAAIRISWKHSNGPYQHIIKTVADLYNYGGFRSFSANGTQRVPGVAYFRVQMVGFDGGRWTSNGPLQTTRQIGYVYGIR